MVVQQMQMTFFLVEKKKKVINAFFSGMKTY